jgi:hypothetical protein
MSAASAARVVCRPIAAGDLPAVTDLLHAGFPKRPRGYWVEGLGRLAARTPPAGYPQFGYLLRAEESVVGVLLLIFSAQDDAAGQPVRGNVSSWYVQPAFRAYAPLLVLRAIRHPAATYVNVSPAPETPPIITAQGFRQFSHGVFAALPLLARRGAMPVRLLARAADWQAAGVPPAALRLLTDHAAFGCISLWCQTGQDGQPLVVRRRRIKPGGIPCAQLIHCRSAEDLETLAAPLGRFLAPRGMPLLLVAGDRPLRGVPGRFFPDRLPMYCKGAETPRQGDLSYTEAALFGL